MLYWRCGMGGCKMRCPPRDSFKALLWHCWKTMTSHSSSGILLDRSYSPLSPAPLAHLGNSSDPVSAFEPQIPRFGTLSREARYKYILLHLAQKLFLKCWEMLLCGVDVCHSTRRRNRFLIISIPCWGEDNTLWELGCLFGIDELSVFLLGGRTCSAIAGSTA